MKLAHRDSEIGNFSLYPPCEIAHPIGSLELETLLCHNATKQFSVVLQPVMEINFFNTILGDVHSIPVNPTI